MPTALQGFAPDFEPIPADEQEPAAHDTAYNLNTYTALEILRKANAEQRQQMLQKLQQTEAPMQSVELVTLEDGSLSLCLYHPSERQRLTHYILNRFPEFQAQGMTKKQYAKHFFNCTSSNLCNIITRESCPRDILITGALMMNPPLNAKELDHALMEICQPGLFTNTYNQEENIRNYVLRCFFDYVAQFNVRQQLVVWPEIADRVLNELELKPLDRQNTDVSDIPGLAGSSERRARLVDTLWAGIKPKIYRWLDEAEACCTATNYMVRRNKHLNDRLKAQNLPADDKRFFDELSAAVCLNDGSAKALFDNKHPTYDKHSNHGDRESLILGAIFLGCTMRETNILLAEANHALLYVFRENTSELDHIAALLQNEIDRERAAQRAAR